MKSIWNGAIGFGLVNIPVKLYSATESEIESVFFDTPYFLEPQKNGENAAFS